MRRAMLPMLAAAAALVAGCGDAERRAAQLDDLNRPNVVFVIADDLSTEMLAYMPNTLRLLSEGTYFSNFIVSDSRCCPSRASLLTGQLPHNTRVFTNSQPRGGLKAFDKHGNQDRTFAVSLRDRGYRTALFGKYLNGYNAGTGGVPAGWTDWAASARAYSGYDYVLNVDGRPRQYGEEPEDYLTDVLAGRGEAFVDSAASDTRPFFLKLSTFTPHLPAVAAPRHIGLVPDVRAPRGPAFNKPVRAAPRWLASRKRIRPAQIDVIDARYRNQIRSVVSIDELVGRIRARLDQRGLADETLFMFTSDNGFHTGQHRLLPGKMTAFDEDIRVPLIVAGPGVPPGATVDTLTQNIDLAPTFEELAGATAPFERDGRSLAPFLRGEPAPADWRTAALVEHRGKEAVSARDPDDQSAAAGNPPTYNALRLPGATYVEYANGEREYYDLRTDPHQRDNIYEQLTAGEQRALTVQLRSVKTCDGAAQCSTVAP